MSWIIYKHISPSGKVYIGQTKKDANQRWRNGKGYLYSNTRFALAIKKYGWDNIKHEIVESDISTQSLANEREIYWINFYNSYDYEFGYNMTLGGGGLSGEATNKARETFKQHNKEKINFIVCYELRKLFLNAYVALDWFISNGYVDKEYNYNPIVRVIDAPNMTCFGYHFCRITNLLGFEPVLQSEINKKKGHKEKVVCIETGDIFESLSDCSRILDIKTQHLSKACKNHSKTHNMHFAYLKEFDDSWQIATKKIYERSTCKKVFCLDLNKEWSSISLCCKEMGINTSRLSRMLKIQNANNIYFQCAGHYFCYSDQVEFANIVEPPKAKKTSRKVILIETKQIFDSISIAEHEMNVRNVLKCCKDWRYTAGGYHWAFYDDNNKFEAKEQIPRQLRNGLIKKVKNVTTFEIYESLTAAAKAIHRNPSTLSAAISNKTKCAGFYWEYV